MTLREFNCANCGKAHFILHEDMPLELRKLVKEELQCPFCGDVAMWERDHNLTETEPPKLDSVKAL